MSQLDLKIGPKIKAFRRQLGIQANKLAEQIGISPSYLNLIDSYFLFVNLVNYYLQEIAMFYKHFNNYYRNSKCCKL